MARVNHPKSRAAGRRRTLYTRAVLCSMCRISEQQLWLWEREELIVPARMADDRGRFEPLYDESTLRRARLIRTLAEELDVNLPGIGIILDLLDRRAR